MSEVFVRKVGIVSCCGEELAEGTVARLAALKVLNELRESGLIDVRERLVWVLDADALEHLKTSG